MDFLDPKAKKRHIRRLFIGYGLMAVLIGLASFLLIIRAYGFEVDRKTGEVIQNGLVFVDSAPDGADIKFNRETQKEKTNNRFALPAGNYDLQINKEGYRQWRRGFGLNGGEVERFTYPLLLQKNLSRQELKSYAAAPGFTTDSPDKRWLIVSQGASITNFTEYDLNSLTVNQPKERQFAVPASLFTQAAGAHSLELVEWSTDNKHFLVKHFFPGGFEFAVVSRDQPETSININKLLNQNPSKVSLRDKKFDSWYLYTEAGGTLQAVDAKKAVINTLTGVSAYKSHGDDTLLYSQLQPDGKTQKVTLQQGNDSYVVKDVVSATVYLDIARYDGKWYTVIGADGEQKTYIFRDPLEVLKKRDGTKPTPVNILKSNGPMGLVGFSQNTRFVVTQNAQHFEIYDVEYEQTYRFDVSKKFDDGSKVVWMDGHRLLARSNGKAVIFDFDGSNVQDLVNSLPSTLLSFDRDYEVLYSVGASVASPGKFSLYGTELRLPADK